MADTISDEKLIAFLHGELSAADAADLESALNDDPALAERLESFSDQDAEIRDAFASIMTDTVPQHLLDAVGERPKSAEIVSIGQARARRAKIVWGLPQWSAMAASLVVGLMVGGQAINLAGAPDAEILAQSSKDGFILQASLQKALASTASGEQVQVAGLGKMDVAITFKSIDGQTCRQFKLQAGAQIDDAVACRTQSQWRLEAFGRRNDVAGEMRTASGEASPAIVSAVDNLIDGDVLVGDAEKAALR